MQQSAFIFWAEPPATGHRQVCLCGQLSAGSYPTDRSDDRRAPICVVGLPFSAEFYFLTCGENDLYLYAAAETAEQEQSGIYQLPMAGGEPGAADR